ncbi:MAG TPA: adenylate/guanylate cyclase domain-containing protein, partial [Leptospiraceae bacterium]|nr:adenylate/guanylate cyclase domain-containing protein [Leptospiraceae bacterium]
AVFGAPAELENQAEKALQAALEMRNALVELNNEFAADNIPNIRIGIGIHSGPVIAGNIGSESRMEYTVIGDTVNTASRLEGLCKEFGKDLIISADVKKLISQNFGLSVSAPISVQIRGKTENQEIYFID